MMDKRLFDESDRIASILSILGNAKRLQIMCYLVERELSVGAIADKVNLSQSALSQHLAKLRALQLVETRRDRQTIFYSCRSVEIARLLEACSSILLSAETGARDKGLGSARH